WAASRRRRHLSRRSARAAGGRWPGRRRSPPGRAGRVLGRRKCPTAPAVTSRRRGRLPPPVPCAPRLEGFLAHAAESRLVAPEPPCTAQCRARRAARAGAHHATSGSPGQRRAESRAAPIGRRSRARLYVLVNLTKSSVVVSFSHPLVVCSCCASPTS